MLKTGHFTKQGRTGRAWWITVSSIEQPVHGEEIYIIKRDETFEIVKVAEVTNSSPPWVCTFTRNTKWTSVPSPQSFMEDDSAKPYIPDDPEGEDSAQHSQQPQSQHPQSVPTPAQGAESDIAAVIMGAVAGVTNKAAKALEARVDKAIEDLHKQLAEVQARPTSTTINIAALPEVKIDGFQHPMFEKTLRLVNAGLNVLLVGEAGCGKTFLSHQVSQALTRTYGTVHCTAGMSESHVSGWLLPTGEAGRFEYHPADFVRLYESGNSLFLLDEIDAADPNVLMFLNGALANGALHIPHRLQGSEVKKGQNVSIMAAANTFGHGANARYAGRNQLDGATLDRFYTVQMDYDKARESAMFGKTANNTPWKAAGEPTTGDLAILGDWVLQLRERTRKAQLRRIVSSRTLDKALTALRAGIPAHEAKADILAGWTADELAKVGESV